MPVNTREIIELLQTLAKDEGIEATVNECVKRGLIIGGASILGGLLFGPLGMAASATVTGCISAFCGKKFVSVVEILEEMEEQKKEALAENVRRIMHDLDVTDVITLATLIAGNAVAKQQIAAELINYLNQEIGIAVACH